MASVLSISQVQPVLTGAWCTAGRYASAARSARSCSDPHYVPGPEPLAPEPAGGGLRALGAVPDADSHRKAHTTHGCEG